MKATLFSTIQEALRSQLDRRFETWIRSESKWNTQLQESALYSFVGGGKALRPTFLVWSYFMNSKKYDRFAVEEIPCSIWNLCLALEMIHTYSLIHDDLPAMDNDDLRRGKPSSHRAFGEAQAILTGDALLTNSFELAAQTPLPNLKYHLEIVKYLATCAGGAQLVGGQVRDLNNSDASFQDLEKTHKQKTGALFSFAFLAGALGSGVQIPEETQLKLKRLGYELGYFFQLSDDLLDMTGDPLKMGKSAQKDLNQNKAPTRLFTDESKLQQELIRVRELTLHLGIESFPHADAEFIKNEISELLNYFLNREK